MSHRVTINSRISGGRSRDPRTVIKPGDWTPTGLACPWCKYAWAPAHTPPPAAVAGWTAGDRLVECPNCGLEAVVSFLRAP